MDRFAIFIDAGHLLAEGGKLCLGVRKRSLFTCEHETAVNALIDYAGQDSDESLLRVYWYDGAHKGIPTLDHLNVAGLKNVKLRLGRMSGGKQKGVDSLIVRDLMTLGRERAMSSAYVLAGDEDLREGVKDAQDCGVRVVLLGVESLELKGNQAETLIQEADEHLVLKADFWRPHFSLRGAPVESTPELSIEDLGDDEELRQKAREIGRQFAEEWVVKALPDEIAELLNQLPSVPRELDSELLAEARKTLPTKEKPWLSKEVRIGFRAVVQEQRSGPQPS